MHFHSHYRPFPIVNFPTFTPDPFPVTLPLYLPSTPHLCLCPHIEEVAAYSHHQLPTRLATKQHLICYVVGRR